jgi:outer membrane protein assembly factor BamA
VIGEYFPETVDADLGSYGEVDALLSGYASAGPATLAARVGGVRQWGTVPFFRAATLGGAESLRGFPAGRFAGDASLYASTELRLRLLRFTVLIPGDVGMILLADAGRVWFEGDSPGGWHADLGGGLTWSPVTTNAAISLMLAGSRESLRVYIGSGFHF